MTVRPVAAPSHGDEKARCAEEPIHIPGSIQPHGVLLALRSGDLAVAHVSANVDALFGTTPDALIGCRLSRVLRHEQAARLERAVRDGDLVGFNPMRFAIDVGGRRKPFDCTMHRSGALIIVEFEPGDAAPSGANGVDLFSVRKPITRLADAPDLGVLARVAATEVRRLSGFDRAMVYRFDAEWHGEIIAEVTSGADVPPTYLGLRFPATDIPEQARRLYLSNPIRLIADADYRPAPLVPSSDAAGAPVDLSGAILRSVSPVHLEYMHNMGVRASMSLSIIIAGRLWGLITCHHRVPHRVNDDVRSACRLIADMLGWQVLSRLAIAERDASAKARESISALGAQLREFDDLGAGLASLVPELLDLFRAQGFALVTGGQLRRAGRTPENERDIERIADALLAGAVDGIGSSHAVGTLIEADAALSAVASGALVITLGEDGSEYLLFLRGEQIATVAWGGDRRATVTERDGVLHPRTSFARWAETVRNESLRWSERELVNALGVRHLVLERSKSIEREAAEARLSYLATHDALTQLPNREALLGILERTLADAQRDGRIFAVLFVDLDHFKLYNDSFGHGLGDRVLRVAATRLRRALRAVDIVARLGGDEFVVISRELDQDSDAERVAQKIGVALSEPIVIANVPEIRLTASIGIATFPQDGQDAQTLLHDADIAMYRAKERGRNGFVRYAAGALEPGHAKIYAQRRIHQAALRGEFVAYYQPIVDLQTGNITAMEALARWKHPKRGLLLPEHFIALAEQSGTIVALGESMLKAACTAAAHWCGARGLRAPRVSVNVSPCQFRDSSFLTNVCAALEESGLAPTSLQLEVTEDVLIEDPAHAIDMLRTLAGTGIRIAIDDFGSGYSSLRYLSHLPVDVLKIDKAFMVGLMLLPQNVAIVRAIIAMARSLNLTVVAEGVEDESPLPFLQAEGCSAVQGFVIEHALADGPAAAFIAGFDGAAFVARISAQPAAVG